MFGSPHLISPSYLSWRFPSLLDQSTIKVLSLTRVLLVDTRLKHTVVLIHYGNHVMALQTSLASAVTFDSESVREERANCSMVSL